jgi:hypothetical protein
VTTRKKRKPRSPPPIVFAPDEIAQLLDPYRAAWLALSPGERLLRSWKLRSRILDLQAVHDAKTLPDL